MPSNGRQQNPGKIWLGIFFLGTAAVAVFLSSSIHSIGLGDNFDPGPKAFPIGLSALLVLGGLVEFFKKKAEKSTNEAQAGMGKYVLMLLAAFALYVLLLPWLGFALSTAIMATTMMMLLGNSWKAAVTLTVSLIIIIYFLFVVLFKVPLPGGVLGMPF